MTSPKVLVLHASAGAGHTQAASAVVEALRRSRPDASVLMADALQFSTAVFRRTYIASYNNIVRRGPGLWGFLWERTADRRIHRLTSRARLTFDKLSVRRMREFLKRERPDAVVSTHFLPLALLSDLRLGRPDANPWPLHCVITDFCAHPFWVFKGVTRYFVSSDNVVSELREQGVVAGRIEVTGIPVHPRFAERGNAREARGRLGLVGDGPTLLVMGGGIGMGNMDKVVERTLGADPRYQCIVVCGRNARLRRRLQEKYQDAEEKAGRLAIRGYVKDVDRLMDAGSLVVSKAGGLTTSESLAKGLPMLILDPIPGQEERNCDYVVGEGAGLRLDGLEDLEDRLHEILRPGGRLKGMQEAAAKIGKPLAAAAIAERVLRGL